MFEIRFTPSARRHLEQFRKYDQRAILDSIEVQLSYEPLRMTRHRKPMELIEALVWELRIGDFRVFYEVVESEQIVVILAIGRKIRNRLFINGEEVLP